MLPHPSRDEWAWRQSDLPEAVKALLTDEAERLRSADARHAAEAAANTAAALSLAPGLAREVLGEYGCEAVADEFVSSVTHDIRICETWPYLVRVTYATEAVGLYPLSVVLLYGAGGRTRYAPAPDRPFRVARPDGETRHSDPSAALASAARYCPVPF